MRPCSESASFSAKSASESTPGLRFWSCCPSSAWWPCGRASRAWRRKSRRGRRRRSPLARSRNRGQAACKRLARTCPATNCRARRAAARTAWCRPTVKKARRQAVDPYQVNPYAEASQPDGGKPGTSPYSQQAGAESVPGNRPTAAAYFALCGRPRGRGESTTDRTGGSPLDDPRAALPTALRATRHAQGETATRSRAAESHRDSTAGRGTARLKRRLAAGHAVYDRRQPGRHAATASSTRTAESAPADTPPLRSDDARSSLGLAVLIAANRASTGARYAGADPGSQRHARRAPARRPAAAGDRARKSLARPRFKSASRRRLTCSFATPARSRPRTSSSPIMCRPARSSSMSGRSRTQARDGSLVWSLGTMQPGEETQITLQVMPQAEGEIGSTAHVTFAAAATQPLHLHAAAAHDRAHRPAQGADRRVAHRRHHGLQSRHRPGDGRA